MGTNNRIRVFIKTSKTGRYNYLLSCVTLGSNGASSTLYSQASYSKITSVHRVVLDAVDRYLSFVKPVSPELNCTLIFYTGNDEIAYEWNSEYIKEGAFSKGTKDADLYSKIIQRANLAGIHISFVGNSSIISSIRKVVG